MKYRLKFLIVTSRNFWCRAAGAVDHRKRQQNSQKRGHAPVRENGGQNENNSWNRCITRTCCALEDLLTAAPTVSSRTTDLLGASAKIFLRNALASQSGTIRCPISNSRHLNLRQKSVRPMSQTAPGRFSVNSDVRQVKHRLDFAAAIAG